MKSAGGWLLRVALPPVAFFLLIVAAWQAAVHHGFYLRFDLAIGGSLPTALNNGRTTPTAPQ